MNNVAFFATEVLQDLLLNNNYDKMTLSRQLNIALYQLNEILYGKKSLEKEAGMLHKLLELKNRSYAK